LHRVSSVALVPLGLWFMGTLLGSEFTYFGACRVFGQPFSAALLLMFVWVALHHSWLGVRVVIEDYVHGGAAKLSALLASQFAHGLLALVATLAVLRIALGDNG
jgi:succinate dehydrogenase / fumarate reductase membrane anchor subunit